MRDKTIYIFKKLRFQYYNLFVLRCLIGFFKVYDKVIYIRNNDCKLLVEKFRHLNSITVHRVFSHKNTRKF